MGGCCTPGTVSVDNNPIALVIIERADFPSAAGLVLFILKIVWVGSNDKQEKLYCKKL